MSVRRDVVFLFDGGLLGFEAAGRLRVKRWGSGQPSSSFASELVVFLAIYFLWWAFPVEKAAKEARGRRRSSVTRGEGLMDSAVALVQAYVRLNGYFT